MSLTKEKLKQWRGSATQAQFADYLGVTDETVSNYETGKTPICPKVQAHYKNLKRKESGADKNFRYRKHTRAVIQDILCQVKSGRTTSELIAHIETILEHKYYEIEEK